MQLVFVLDHIRSAWNVGSIFRTADALGASLCLVGYTPKPVGKTLDLIKKTAIGAEKTVVWQHFDTAQELLNVYPSSQYLKHIGLEITSTSQDLFCFLLAEKDKYKTENSFCKNLKESKQGTEIFRKQNYQLQTKTKQLLLEKKYFLWFGNEISGLSEKTLQQLDQVCHLRMQGQKESLNVASCVCAVGYLFQFAFKDQIAD